MSPEIVAAILGSTVVNQCVSAAVRPLFNRRRHRLDEAAIISDISAQLRQELFEHYEERGKTIGRLRRAIIQLTNLLEQLFPRILGLTAVEINRLKETALEARLAGLAAEI